MENNDLLCSKGNTHHHPVECPMEMKEIKNCPCCGKKVFILVSYNEYDRNKMTHTSITCRCGILMTGDNKASIAKAWNRRVK